MLGDHLLEDVPDVERHRLDVLLRRLDVLDRLPLDEPAHDERLEELERHRAAEELGIDLSPAAVRAAAGELSAQEIEEGAAAVGEGGDVAVAADESLDGVEADAELEVGLADVELDD